MISAREKEKKEKPVSITCERIFRGEGGGVDTLIGFLMHMKSVSSFLSKREIMTSFDKSSFLYKME